MKQLKKSLGRYVNNTSVRKTEENRPTLKLRVITREEIERDRCKAYQYAF